MDFDFSGIIPAMPGLWNGMVMTLKLMVMGVVGGIILGTILALMRLSSSKLLSRVAGASLSWRHTSWPDMPGIITSSNIRSGAGLPRAICRAFSPEPASFTR